MWKQVKLKVYLNHNIICLWFICKHSNLKLRLSIPCTSGLKIPQTQKWHSNADTLNNIHTVHQIKRQLQMSLLLLLFAAVVISFIAINIIFKVISCFILKGPSSFAFCLDSLFLALFLFLTWITSIGFTLSLLILFVFFPVSCSSFLFVLSNYIFWMVMFWFLDSCLQWFFNLFVFDHKLVL